MGKQPSPKSRDVQIYSRVKQLMETDILQTANDFLDTGDWILLSIRKGQFSEWAYVLGRIR